MNKIPFRSVLSIRAGLMIITVSCLQAAMFNVTAANTIVQTNTLIQIIVTNQPEQISQITAANNVELPQFSTAVVLPQTNNIESQSKHAANASPEKIKAFKTLDFGDDDETVKKKLAEIVVGAEEKPTDDSGFFIYQRSYENDGTFWRSLFDTDAEYEPYKCPGSPIGEKGSDKFVSLEACFLKFRPGVIFCRNDVFSVNCFLLNDGYVYEPNGLVVVEVTYLTFDTDKLVAGFMQNFPNARKENRHYKSELLPSYPGAFVEYDKTVYSDINEDRRATLLIDAGKRTITFTEPSQLSESDKALLLNKDFKPDAPEAVFASKQILDPIMNNYRQSIVAEAQAEKDKLKKESDSSAGF